MVDEGRDDFCVWPLLLREELVREAVPALFVGRVDLCQVGVLLVQEGPERDEVALDGFGDARELLEGVGLTGGCLCDTLLLCDLLCARGGLAQSQSASWSRVEGGGLTVAGVVVRDCGDCEVCAFKVAFVYEIVRLHAGVLSLYESVAASRGRRERARGLQFPRLVLLDYNSHLYSPIRRDLVGGAIATLSLDSRP